MTTDEEREPSGRVAGHLAQGLERLASFPWATTANTLRVRFREDRLGLTASSLTFTTLLALVPFVTVALALFTAFPIFAQVEDVLQRWLVSSLIPATIANQVLDYVTQFASKASRLGLAGLSALLVTALALILTIDRTLNAIWRVPRLRPLGQRVLIYWAAITLGPVVLGLSLALTSSAVAASRSMFGSMPLPLRLLFDSIEFVLMALGMSAMYRYVPNTHVPWRFALAGGVFVALGIELAKKMLGLYLASVPVYSMIYGTFATLPILLVWLYVAWVIVLLGAVVAAYLPSLLAGVHRLPTAQSWDFQLALEALQALGQVRFLPEKGLRLHGLAARLGVEEGQLRRPLEVLTQLDWVGAVADVQDGAAMPVDSELRYLLLIDPAATRAQPLFEALLLEHNGATDALWWHCGLDQLMLIDVLQKR